MVRKTKRIPLTNGGSVEVDAADYPRLSRHKWYRVHNGKQTYAARREGTGSNEKIIYMHREVTSSGPGEKLIHHKGAHGLDDTRGNLKPATQSQNQRGVKHDRKKKSPR